MMMMMMMMMMLDVMCRTMMIMMMMMLDVMCRTYRAGLRLRLRLAGAGCRVCSARPSQTWACRLLLEVGARSWPMLAPLSSALQSDAALERTLLSRQVTSCFHGRCCRLEPTWSASCFHGR